MTVSPAFAYWATFMAGYILGAAVTFYIHECVSRRWKEKTKP